MNINGTERERDHDEHVVRQQEGDREETFEETVRDTEGVAHAQQSATSILGCEIGVNDLMVERCKCMLLSDIE